MEARKKAKNKIQSRKRKKKTWHVPPAPCFSALTEQLGTQLVKTQWLKPA